nr:MAG TPA: BING4CT domain protein [Bacteriophage sp.]
MCLKTKKAANPSHDILEINPYATTRIRRFSLCMCGIVQVISAQYRADSEPTLTLCSVTINPSRSMACAGLIGVAC